MCIAIVMVILGMDGQLQVVEIVQIFVALQVFKIVIILLRL